MRNRFRPSWQWPEPPKGYFWASFLSDIRRLNVGMTRARRKLLLVGDSTTLCRHPFFGELLAHVKSVGGYRKALAV